MRLIPVKSPLIKSGDALAPLILKCLLKTPLRDGDVLVISSKVVSYAEGRLVSLKEDSLRQWIEQEADIMVDRDTGLTITQGCFIPFAGIDQSNVPEGMAILWPKNPFASAAQLQKSLAAHFHLKRLGILISDSTCHPLRRGTGGLAIGWAGFKGVEDERGKKDLFGKPLRITQKAVADNLASAALLLTGEAAERTPFVIIRGTPVRFTAKKINPKEAIISPQECLFRSLYPKKITRQ